MSTVNLSPLVGDGSVNNSPIFDVLAPKYVVLNAGTGIPLDGNGSGIQDFALPNPPADFVSATSVLVTLNGAFFSNSPNLSVAILESDESTPLTGSSGNIVPLLISTPTTIFFYLTPSSTNNNVTDWTGAFLSFSLTNFNDVDFGQQGEIYTASVTVAYISFIEVVSGGALASGQANVYEGDDGTTDTPTVSGGALASGIAAVSVTEQTSGGALASGAGLLNAFTWFAVTGSSPGLSDPIGEPYAATYIYNPTSGIILGSDTTEHIGLIYVTNGNIISLSGSAFAAIGSTSGIGINPIIVSGSAEVLVNEFYDLPFLWNIITEFTIDKQFLWDTGELPIMTFRIVSKCQQDSLCEPVSNPQDPCTKQVLITLTARTASEVCQRLTAEGNVFSIATFERFSLPAEVSQINALAAQGIDVSCSTLIPVDFRSIPACLPFTIDFDETQLIGFFAEVAINSFFTIPVSGTPSIVISGTATGLRITYNYHHYHQLGSGGALAGGGIVNLESSYNTFTPSGEIIVSGTTGVPIAPEYVYNVDACPKEILGFGQNYNTLLVSVEAIWNDPSGALNAPDNQYAWSTLGGAHSESDFLTIFPNFTVPDGTMIYGITVAISKWANTAISGNPSTYYPISDYKIQLVSDNIISENKALPNYWTPTESIAIYGNSSDTWGETWTSDDINSPNFGILISAINNDPSENCIAFIDAVEFAVAYCDASGIIISGDAFTTCSSYSTVANGGILITGVDTGIFGPLYFTLNYIASGMSIQVGGSYASALRTSVGNTGGILIGGTIWGSVISSSWHFAPSGGIDVDGTTSGHVISSGWTAVGKGSIDVSGLATLILGLNYFASGTIIVGGIYSSRFNWMPIGGIIVDGGIDTPFISNCIIPITGNGHNRSGVLLSGVAFVVFSDLGDVNLLIAVVTEVTSISVIFSTLSITPTPLPTTTVSVCGCTGLPLVLNIQHNIAQSNKFSQFLLRNGQTMPINFSLFYNKVFSAWQNNFYFKGANATAGIESWTLLFDLQCTDILGGQTIGTDVLRLMVQVIQKDLTLGATYATRLLTVFGAVPFCQSGRDFAFSVSINTLFGTAQTSPVSTIQDVVVYDNIGLFKTGFWDKNPNVVLSISEVGTSPPVNRINITPNLSF